MRKLDYLHQKKLSPTDELRDILKQLEDSQPQLNHINPTQALITLRNLDQADQLFNQLEATGADLAAERGRFDSIQAHLKKHVGPFLKGFGGASTLAEFRPKPIPSRERWWWFIDELVAAQQRRTLKRVIIAAVIGLSLLAGLIIAFKTVLAPSPEAVARIKGEDNAFAAFDEGDYTGSLAAVDQALVVVPNDPGLLVIRGVTLEALGRVDEAQQSFDRAQTLYENPVNFHIGRGQIYLRTNQFEKTETEARSALAIDETNATAWLLLGQSLELQDKRADAIAAYQQASELAVASGNNEVVVLARLALGRMSSVP
ncbi:MAG: tetratricopeptide repeat protein [Anaerolineae bacterium]|nr:tetratricopeptide repeat protein [Anaerolineae bacterium]MCB9105886.1 tetratricopeptide repeat protein [Anaerolineales bacterium]